MDQGSTRGPCDFMLWKDISKHFGRIAGREVNLGAERVIQGLL